MSEVKTGGPALPLEDGVHRGITTRDYFAAKAMNGILKSAIDWFPTHKSPDQETLALFAEVAQDSYAIADAMLKAREM